MGGGHGIASTDLPTQNPSTSTGNHLYRSLDQDLPVLGEFSGKPKTKVGCAQHFRLRPIRDQGNNPQLMTIPPSTTFPGPASLIQRRSPPWLQITRPKFKVRDRPENGTRPVDKAAHGP